MRFSLLGQAAVCKQQLLVGTSFAAFASGWIRKLTCSAVPPPQSKPAALGFALVPGEGDARLRPEWRQGIRKDRAANPVFSDITFKWRKEAQSLRRCAPPPFTQGRLWCLRQSVDNGERLLPLPCFFIHVTSACAAACGYPRRRRAGCGTRPRTGTAPAANSARPTDRASDLC